MSAAARQRLTAEALAMFDEISTSGTSWSDPDSVDGLVVNIILPEIRIPTVADARKILLLVLGGATVPELRRAVERIRDDRDGMRASIAEDQRASARERGRSKAARPRRAA